MPDLYSFETLLGFCRYADEHGYYSISLGDGFLAKARWDPIVLHTAIAMVTKKVKLATATLNINYRHPIQFARDWAVMDQISKGRSILGLGLGTAATGTKGEEAAFSLRREMQVSGNGSLYDIRGTMLEEWIELVKELWTNKLVSYHGRCFDFDGVPLEPKPYQKPRPMILMAAGYGTAKDIALKRLARVADGWLVDGGTSPELYGPAFDRLRAYLKEKGRDCNTFETAYQVTGAIGSNLQKMRKEMAWWLKTHYGTDESMRLDWWGPQGDSDAWLDWMTRCADAGIKTFIVRFATKNLDEQVRLFTKQVMPSF